MSHPVRLLWMVDGPPALQQPISDRPPECPACGEDRQVEIIRTLRQQVYLCAVCSHTWPGPACES